MITPAQLGKTAALIVRDTPAWSLILGRDALPQQLLSPVAYGSQKLIVVSKHQGKFFAYDRRENFTGSAQLSEPLYKKLGLRFQPMKFEAAKGTKRTRAGGLGSVLCRLGCTSSASKGAFVHSGDACTWCAHCVHGMPIAQLVSGLPCVSCYCTFHGAQAGTGVDSLSGCVVMCRPAGWYKCNSQEGHICTSTQESFSQRPPACCSLAFRAARGPDLGPWRYQLELVASDCLA